MSVRELNIRIGRLVIDGDLGPSVPDPATLAEAVRVALAGRLAGTAAPGATLASTVADGIGSRLTEFTPGLPPVGQRREP